MNTITRTFYDVEHDGDIRQIKDVIHNNGGKVLSENFNYEAEQVELTFQVPDDFKQRIKNDESEDAHYYFGSRY